MNAAVSFSRDDGNLARSCLAAVIQRHGRGLLENSQRCELLVLESCSDNSLASAVLIQILKQKMPQRLLQLPKACISLATIDELAEELACKVEVALPVEDWRWGISSWAEALGLRVATRPEGATANGATYVAAAVPDVLIGFLDDPLAATLKPWRPIASNVEARSVILVGLLVSFFVTVTLASFYDELDQTLLLIASTAFVANLGALVWPWLGYATFALGSAGSALLSVWLADGAVDLRASSHPVAIGTLLLVSALIVLVWLSFLATFRAARFLRSQ
jgi:multisubunit Na+/H+ antiporter MnhF subunit